MIIPVTIDEAASSDARRHGGSKTDEQTETSGVCVPQWSMVELQGELISKDPLSGQPLGSMTSENGKPMLVISNHKLEGKAASEPKPLLVLRKVLVDVDDENNSGDGGRRNGGSNGGAAGTAEGVRPQQRQQRVEYRVVGRVTRKTIFKTRPKPLIRKLGDGGGHGGGSTARSCM
ncbi:unnamed protein product [Scytosiphon promiscuus]